MAGAVRNFLGAILALLLLSAGCGGFYAPLGENPARLEVAVQGRIDQKDINQAVFQQVGSLRDQPTPWHWLGLPTWQVDAYMLGRCGGHLAAQAPGRPGQAPGGHGRPGRGLLRGALGQASLSTHLDLRGHSLLGRGGHLAGAGVCVSAPTGDDPESGAGAGS